jgi:hypothetical protein
MEKELEEKINNLFVGKTKRKVKTIIKMLNSFSINLKIDVEGGLKNAIIKCYIKTSTIPKEFLKTVIRNKYFCGITIDEGIYLTFIIPYY